MIYKYPPLVEVLWADATGIQGWFESGDWDARTYVIARTQGYMLKKNRKMVTLATHVRDDNIVGDIFIIPKRCILHIETLAKFDKNFAGGSK